MERNNTSWFREKILMGRTFGEFIRDNITIGNMIAFIILIFGIYAMVYRLIYGLGPSTNLSDEYPWGIWIGWDVLVAIALAGSGFSVGTVIHLFGLEEYHHFARFVVLSSLLRYVFEVFCLLFDLGRYYNIYVMLIRSWGFSSVLFLVGWHFFLYTNICLVEFAPAVFEWLDLKRVRDFFAKLVIWATMFGAIIAVGHQSALGGLYLVAPYKLHPLWYSALLPLFFVISAIFGGISIAIIEATIIQKAIRHQMEDFVEEDFNRKLIGLGKAAACVLYIYLILKLLDFAHYEKWHYLKGFYGFWYTVELSAFVFIPALMFTSAVRNRIVWLVKLGAVLTAFGVVVNRLNVSIFAYKWYIPLSQKYYPAWTEIALSAGVFTLMVLTYRFVLNRMAVFYEHPKYRSEH